jgi:hypothetical protein
MAKDKVDYVTTLYQLLGYLVSNKIKWKESWRGLLQSNTTPAFA